MTHPTQIKLAAYLALLVTLFLPFSRCSHATPPPAPAGTVAADGVENAPESPSEAEPTSTSPPAPNGTSPWYHLFEQNTAKEDYEYGMDLLIESWSVPKQVPKEFDPMWLVPGRMFYLWPLATLAIALWWPPVRWRRSFHAIEIGLGLGGMYWVAVAVVMNDPRRGFYVALSALGLYALTALYELIVEWRRLRKTGRTVISTHGPFSKI